MTFRFMIAASTVLALAACGANQATAPAAPVPAAAPASPPPTAQPAVPISAMPTAVQPPADPSTRDGRMSEALKDYEASKGARAAAAPAPTNAKSKAKKPLVAKKPDKPASAASN